MKIRTYSLLLAMLPLLLALGGCPMTLISSMTPDLTLTLGRFDPATTTGVKGGVGGTLSLPVTISDLTGGIVSGAYTVSFTLSTDASLTTTADNTSLGDVSVDASAVRVVSLTVPAAVTAGSYTLFAALAAGASSDATASNNTAAIDVTIGANVASLGVTLSLPDSMVPPEGTFTTGYRVSNTGYAPVAAGTTIAIAFTASIGATVVGAPGAASITLEGDLYPDAYVTGSTSLTMPSITAMGYTADTFTGALVTLAATATSTTGLTASASASVTAPALKPDLTVSSVALPNDAAYVKAGATMQASVTLENTGYAVAPAGYGVTLFADVNASSTYDSGDVALYAWDAPAAVPFDATGLHNTLVLTVPDGQTFPTGVPTSGSYYIGAAITGVSGEMDTADNTGVSAAVSFVSSAVDLTLDRMTTTLASTLPLTGGTIPLTLRIRNAGVDDVNTPFVVHFYATNDATISTTTDLDLGTVTVSSAIAAKKSATVNATAAVPATTSGFYTLYWTLDSTGVYSETNEDNNTVTSANSCFVYFIVSGGTGSVNGRLLLMRPQGSSATYDGSLYGCACSSVVSGVWTSLRYFAGGADEDGEVYGYANMTISLASGFTFGAQAYSYDSGGAPYAFRVVPAYITSAPVTALPSALSAEDSYEENDSESTATSLSGSSNPLYGWVNALTKYTYSGFDYDYYTFSMP